MSLARLRVVFAGPHVTVQDAGRPKFMRYGVTGAGPMDRASFALAQAALGNRPDVPAIEVSLGGLTVECVEGAVALAIVGGAFRVTLDGRALPAWAVARLEPGQRLAIRPGPWGSWTYLAFAGRLHARAWLGSSATHALSNLGGGAVLANQMLEIEASDSRDIAPANLGAPDGPSTEPLRIVLGPQDRHFAKDTIARLLDQPFRLTDAYDRMGVRLAGPDLTPASALDMPSEALLRGSLQVAGDGVASVMLADHGTTGGYPKIATLIGPDVDRLAQRRSGDEIRFTAITPRQAVAAAREAAEARRRSARPSAADLAAALLSQNLIDGVVSGAL